MRGAAGNGRSYRDPRRLPQENEGRDVPRTATGRGDREDLASLWFVAVFNTEGATRRGQLGPRAGCRLFRQLNGIPGPSRPAPGTDVRRYLELAVPLCD